MSAASSKTPDAGPPGETRPLEARPATIADLIAKGGENFELIDGEVVPRELTSTEHGIGLGALAEVLSPFRRRAGGPKGPGGWWIAIAPTIQLTVHQVLVPDVAGWRRERVPQMPTGFPQFCRPDWVCEIHAHPDARRRDLLQKRRVYSEATIPHYWLIDTERHTLTVLRLEAGVYVERLHAEREHRVRAEPFEALELQVGILFGDDAD